MDTPKTKQQTLFSEQAVQNNSTKAKPIIPARTAINWYYGNFLMSPGNALRDIDEEQYLDDAHKLVDSLYLEFEGQKITQNNSSI